MQGFFTPTVQSSEAIKKATPWVEKYRPATVDDVVQQDEVVRTLRRSLETGNLPHLLFYGPPGTGKTTTITAIARQLYGPQHFRERMLELNASDERGIAVVRDKVKQFAQLSAAARPPNCAYPWPSYKLVVLDEADSMTSDAQAALRRVMETYSSSTRFCLICNYVSRIIEPLASRCAKFRFRPLQDEAVEARLQHVAHAEQLVLSDDCAAALRRVSRGDLRKAISLMQSSRALLGATLTADGIIELAGVVPDQRIARLLALTVGSEAGSGAFGPLREACRDLMADGYSAKRVVTQFADELVVRAGLDEVKISHALLVLAEAEHALVEGADEYLQLLHAMTATAKLMRG